MRKWYKLDNVGKFYASTNYNKVPKVFRYSAILKDNIDEDILQEALNKTIEVYPNFNVNLKRGLFWYYLDEVTKVNKVKEENLPICFKLYNNSDDYLYRISYYKRKINVEISHIISDGRGSVEFFKLLVSHYVNIKYKLKIDVSYENKSMYEKTEDSFTKYYKSPKLSFKEKKVPYIYKGKKYRNQTLYLETHMSVKKALEMAHKYKTTLTGLLVSILIYSYKDILTYAEMNKYIKIDIPVDLRSYFSSSSSKNFFGLTNVCYKFNSNNDTLEEIIKSVSSQLKENLIKEKLVERVNLMVSFEKLFICRCAPIFLKDAVINLIDKYTSQNSTSCLSNVGVVKFNDKIEDHIESISVLTATSSYQFTICSFQDDLCIGISNQFINNNIIKNFCRFFSDNGLDVTIDMNEVER